MIGYDQEQKKPDTVVFGCASLPLTVAPGLDLTVAQVTVLVTMILLAHSLPVELRIAEKAGTRFRASVMIRVIGALLPDIFRCFCGFSLHEALFNGT